MSTVRVSASEIGKLMTQAANELTRLQDLNKEMLESLKRVCKEHARLVELDPNRDYLPLAIAIKDARELLLKAEESA